MKVFRDGICYVDFMDITRFVELYKQEYEKKNFAKRLTKVRKSL